MKTFAFKFQNARKILLYLLLTILSPIVGLTILIVLDSTSTTAFLLATLLPLAIGVYLMFRNGKAEDTITLDSSGFTSTYHGRINLDDIDQIIHLKWYQRNPPSMSLRLKSGQKISWWLTYNSNVFNSREDAVTFAEFTAALQTKLDTRYAKKLHSKIPSTYEDPAIQLKREGEKNKNAAIWTVPLSFAIALIGLVKACGKDWIKDRGPNFSQFTAMQADKFDKNIQVAKLMVDSMSKAQGAVYLYSNDTGAIIKLLPNISVSEPTSIKLFELTANNEQLDKFIEHPDSFQLKMIIWGGDSVMRSMSKSIMNYDDSAAINLFIRCYDPKHLINPPGSTRGQTIDSSTAKPFDMTTGIPLYDTLQPGKAISRAYPGMNIMLAQVNHSPSFRIYLAGRQQDGISAALFQKSVYALNKQFAAVGVDTTRFMMRTFYDK
ncbi:MAG: hypothetical protein JO154_13865 [Chitinophaga sp.]|uniref:hypothetical protein n=1 Tax=Chitinophaga sp. TaxID=1869181 RepID=UPI0025C697E1|nr:hypothetical protein [Chitinophaga sp.]MBV8253690.1 hypothetical protein [Chitinophaga sp.]